MKLFSNFFSHRTQICQVCNPKAKWLKISIWPRRFILTLWWESLLYSIISLVPSQTVPRPAGQTKPNITVHSLAPPPLIISSRSSGSHLPVPTDRRPGLATAVQQQTTAVCLSCSQSARLTPLVPPGQSATVSRVPAAFPRLQTARERGCLSDQTAALWQWWEAREIRSKPGK